MGKRGIGKCNSNDELLLALCSEFELIVTNTMFKQTDESKTTWMHPRSRRSEVKSGFHNTTKAQQAREKVLSAIGRVLSRRWTVLSPNRRRRKTQHQTRNGQLCSRSYTTQPRHILASQTENSRTGSTPTTRSYRLL